MIEMPPLQHAQVNGIKMGYYEAGSTSSSVPVILCHGWPEIAFCWLSGTVTTFKSPVTDICGPA